MTGQKIAKKNHLSQAKILFFSKIDREKFSCSHDLPIFLQKIHHFKAPAKISRAPRAVVSVLFATYYVFAWLLIIILLCR